jgi:hypothetical protein
LEVPYHVIRPSPNSQNERTMNGPFREASKPAD